MRQELDLQMAEWNRIRTIVSEMVAHWTPILDINCMGTVMYIPVELLHRYKGSLMDQFFSRSYGNAEDR